MSHQYRILARPCPQSAVSIFLGVTLSISSQAQNADTMRHTVTLKQGQVLEVKLVTRLDSGRAKVGDPVGLRLAKPLLADGITILPAGWAVSGRVTDVKRAGKNCQQGFIGWEIEPITMTDGKKIEIHSVPGDIAKLRLVDQGPHATAPPNPGATTTPKKGSSAGGIVRDIALGSVAVLIFSALVLRDVRGYGEYESCSRGKGREDSIRGGTTFYTELSNDVQQNVE